MARRYKVLLCGYYGMGNAGDELLAAASISLLERCGVPRQRIAMLSGNLAESERVHGVAAFARRELKSVVRAARASETLLLGGGGIFQDSSGPFSPWYYWGVMKIAATCGCRAWAVGQSIGPLRRRVSRLAAKSAFAGCAAVTVRDKHSQDFLAGRCVLADDLVLTLPTENNTEPARNGILVNFRPCGGLERTAARDFSAQEWTRGRKVIGVAMSPEDARTMESLCRGGLLRLDDLRVCSPDNWQSAFAGGACAFGMRLHFGVLCLKLDILCRLVPYDPKVSDFAARWGGDVWGENGGAPRPWQNRELLYKAVQNTVVSFAESFEKATRV